MSEDTEHEGINVYFGNGASPVSFPRAVRAETEDSYSNLNLYDAGGRLIGSVSSNSWSHWEFI